MRPRGERRWARPWRVSLPPAPRRRDTEQVEERQVLLPGRDYEVDPLQGRILLQSPLSQVMRERLRNVVRTRPLDGDDVFLLVDYEYLTADFDADDRNNFV